MRILKRSSLSLSSLNLGCLLLVYASRVCFLIHSLLSFCSFSVLFWTALWWGWLLCMLFPRLPYQHSSFCVQPMWATGGRKEGECDEKPGCLSLPVLISSCFRWYLWLWLYLLHDQPLSGMPTMVLASPRIGSLHSANTTPSLCSSRHWGGNGYLLLLLSHQSMFG